MRTGDEISAVRPKLRHNTIFFEVSDGVFLRNNDTAFVLHGQQPFRWISSLSGHLTGEHTVAELIQGLSPQQQETVTQLIKVLLSRNLVLDRRPETTDLPPEVIARFQRQINFIEHYADRPLSRFSGFRHSRVLLAGSGRSFGLAGLSLLRNGLALITVDERSGRRHEAPGSQLAGTAQLEAEAERLRSAGAPAEVRRAGADIDPGQFDVVLYCADVTDTQYVMDLNRSCHQAGTRFLPLVIVRGQALLGPLIQPGGPCWNCAVMRLVAGSGSTMLWRELATGPWPFEEELPAAPLLSMMGNAAAFDLFKELTGALVPDAAASVVVQDLETLEITREALLAHPLCPVCSADPAEGNALQSMRTKALLAAVAEPAPAPEQIYERLNALVAPHVGPLISYDDDPVVQTPVKVGVVRAAIGTRIEQTAAFDQESVLSARLAATSDAVRRYAGKLPDAGGMETATVAEMRARRPVAGPEELATWAGARPLAPEDAFPWLAAVSVFSQEEYAVPAAAVYPSTSLNAGHLFERSPGGSAAGTSPASALESGLVSALGYEILRDLITGEAAAAPVPASWLETDETLGFLLDSLRRLGHTVTVHECVSPAPVCVVLASATGAASAEPLWAARAGLSLGTAAGQALTELLGRLQLAQSGLGAAATPEPLMPDFDPRASFRQESLPASHLTGSPAGRDQIEDYLTARGRDALVVATTPADISSSRTFETCRVLLRGVRRAR